MDSSDICAQRQGRLSLLGNNKQQQAHLMPHKNFKFDRINKKIIEALQDNARISNLELAEKVHLSPSACLKRTKKLEEQGYIRRYTTNLDLAKMCVSVTVISNITLTDNRSSHGAGRFEQAIKKEPCAVECYKVGGEIDYVVHFICVNLEQYEKITENLLDQDIGIARITSHVALSTPKPFAKYPLDELLWLVDND
ncbi:Lrp/AsnC family transcriptional regulator [Dasania sp. GY-MA-18]|uniref:Lrp/AsnC family transcriptional regulator n=1 Tax=Dasania phycosphaerae TaxID=2950436 RepID=A0A9J6RRU7_9GAMM|nr:MULTISPECIES: Lrp/AsnC family transcriptional regulator [Dasania]MCR8924226.1 Lrp/AsnC family transcriptional regulator [Dasania sp. GY-MA-18]MCZ0866879.1 Lrp/AsnC family transcriptional regulator [Dasania phycosphaerae]MCZ0870383.1 Lrp/AsnC family transcriptional regulator [Dasania phycosphaerae]